MQHCPDIFQFDASANPACQADTQPIKFLSHWSGGAFLHSNQLELARNVNTPLSNALSRISVLRDNPP